MKFAEYRPYADPEVTAHRIMEIAKGITPAENDKIYIELINYPMLSRTAPSRANTGPACNSRSRKAG